MRTRYALSVLALCLVVSAGLTGCASVAKEKQPPDKSGKIGADEQAERDRLAGTWVLQTMLQDEKEAENSTSTWQFHGEVVAMDRFPTPYALDPTRTPKRIWITLTPTDPSEMPEQVAGIYEIDGDTFKSCFGAPDEPRPTDFASKPGDRRTYSIWKRAGGDPQ